MVWQLVVLPGTHTVTDVNKVLTVVTMGGPESTVTATTLLREFVAANGNVFAVAWSGPFMPNLRQAMGKYFDSYVAAPRSTISDRKHLQVSTPELVVQASGHTRAFAGRAYLPAAIPAGFNLGDLQ